MINGGSACLNMSLNIANPGPSSSPSFTSQVLEHVKVALRSNGYSKQSAAEITSALGVLAKYGILCMAVGLGASSSASNHSLMAHNNYMGLSSMDSSAAAAAAAAAAVAQQPPPADSNGGGVFGPIGTVSALGSSSPTPRPSQLDRFGEAATPTTSFDPFRHQSSPTNLGSPINLNNNSFGLGTGQQTPMTTLCKSPTPGEKDQKKVDMEIGENIVGAILGPGGRSLVEIQHLSGANIQISKKGIYAPGTRNRIVSIAGLPNAITTAQFLIEQRISEEEAKRARHTALSIMQ